MTLASPSACSLLLTVLYPRCIASFKPIAFVTSTNGLSSTV
jgi:hypothetical protein